MRGWRGGWRLFSASALALALLLVIVAAIAAQLNLQRLRKSFDWVAHTQQVLLQVGTIDADLASAVAAQRGFLLTGDPAQLTAFHEFSSDLGSQMNVLEQLVTSSSQRQRLHEARSLIERRLARLEHAMNMGIVAYRGTGSVAPDEEERQVRAAIRQVLRRFRDAEVALLNDQQQQAEWDATGSTVISATTVLMALGAAALGVFLLQRERERSRMHELQAELLHISRLNTVGQTASMLAHEVNQPLTAARNYLGAAQRMLGAETIQAERIADVVQRSLVQVDRASEIIHRLRQFVRRSDPCRSVEPVGVVISEAITVSALERAGSRIVQQIPADLPLASIDKVQIQQVLVNLMRNALEAMADSERKELTITARRLGRDTIQISVQDTGPGLAKDVAAKLFQPFVTTKEDGMGVGLSICRRIVEAHGGRIWAEPSSSGGTVFHFTIPGTTEPDSIEATKLTWQRRLVGRSAWGARAQ